jgi:uncharacterized protein (DUF362 family)/NAD-dependent dihydropyrimidine dehydrogenase PreA subunit
MKTSRVLVRRVTSLSAAVAEALDFIGYDFSGRRVWVKPNLLGAHAPEDGVTTDPELVRGVVRELKRRKAAAIRVYDNPGGSLDTDVENFVRPTGVVEASEGTFSAAPDTPVLLRLRSRFVSEVPASSLVTDCDVILNLPVFKTHTLTILTGAVKNLFGIVCGGHKSYLHTVTRTAAEFAELLVDIYQAVPVPVLTVVDALRGMDGQNGPSGGRVLSLGRILAGSNPVAVDAVMAMMAGADPDSIPTIRIAAERGLGPSDSTMIETAGDFAVLPGFRLPSRRIAAMATGLAGSAVYRLLTRRPLCYRRLCTRCRRCADNCPAKAIAMTPCPTIDQRSCIMCYCCVELCPERAMLISGLLRSLLRNVAGL